MNANCFAWAPRPRKALVEKPARRALNSALPCCRLGEEMHERGAIGCRADALLGHLGAGRKGCWANLEQPRHSLRCPHDIKRLERCGEIVARQRRDPAPEDTGKGRANAIAPVAPQCVARDAGTTHF